MAKILGAIPREIPTEQAAVAFGLLAGLGGGAAQWIAGRRLSGYQGDTLPIGNLVIPVLIGGASTAAAAFLLPSQ